MAVSARRIRFLVCPLLALTAADAVAQGRSTAPPLPPIPAVSGPLALRIVYPANNQRIEAVDSTFFFGSTGSGAASLTVNGWYADSACATWASVGATWRWFGPPGCRRSSRRGRS